MGICRIGIGLQEHQLERLRSICGETGATQNGLFAAMASVCSVAEVKDILARYEQLQLIESDLRQTADASLLSYIRGRSLEELRTMVAASKAA